jgi:hypothetical protein
VQTLFKHKKFETFETCTYWFILIWNEVQGVETCFKGMNFVSLETSPWKIALCNANRNTIFDRCCEKELTIHNAIWRPKSCLIKKIHTPLKTLNMCYKIMESHATFKWKHDKIS